MGSQARKQNAGVSTGLLGGWGGQHLWISPGFQGFDSRIFALRDVLFDGLVL